ENTIKFFSNEPETVSPAEFVGQLSKEESNLASDAALKDDNEKFLSANSDLDAYVNSLDEAGYKNFVYGLNIPEDKKTNSGWNIFKHKIPTWIFLITTLILTFISFKNNLSLIPLLGLISCLYMMSELGVNNWKNFTGWLILGLIIYFTFSYKNSKLNKIQS